MDLSITPVLRYVEVLEFLNSISNKRKIKVILKRHYPEQIGEY
jgi:hypothetical protein